MMWKGTIRNYCNSVQINSTQIDFISYLFQDHNYGQPPPETPPDSNSPGPEEGDTGNEDDDDEGITRCIW